MYIKIAHSGPRAYVQLVESFRDETGRVKKRTLANLGRLDEISGSLDSVIKGLLKISGRSPDIDTAPPDVRFASAKSFGDVWTLTELWNELGFAELRRVFRRTRHTTDVEAMLRIMVFNRLCDADSKLGVLRWLETVALPGVQLTTVTHQQLLRSMDALIEQHDAVDEVIAGLLRPLIDQDLSVVFYDMTTIRSEGTSELDNDVRHYGPAKEGGIARQFMLGVVQTAEGLPIYHEVFAGNTAESPTLLPTLDRILSRFPGIQRLILVADRGLLSLDNLAALQATHLSNGHPLEFILAVPARRYHEFADLLEAGQARCLEASEEVVDEYIWQGLRLVVAHDPQAAAAQTARRQAQIDELLVQAQAWTGKLDEQDAGVTQRGRKLSDSGAKARFYHAVCEAHLSKIIRVDLKAELFCYEVDSAAKSRAELLDGKLLLVTNSPDLRPDDVLGRYKSLADIERGFKVMKSELEIGPCYHRLPDRIRAHAAICFMGLILHRVMRMRLRAANADLSPERAIAQLQRIHHHQVSINGGQPIAGVSTLTPVHHDIVHALGVKKPTIPQQLTLL